MNAQTANRTGPHYENATYLANSLKNHSIHTQIWHGNDNTIEMQIFTDNPNQTTWLTINPSFVAKLTNLEYPSYAAFHQTKTETHINPEEPNYHNNIIKTIILCLQPKPPENPVAPTAITKSNAM